MGKMYFKNGNFMKERMKHFYTAAVTLMPLAIVEG
jgi:hypothetical protein